MAGCGSDSDGDSSSDVSALEGTGSVAEAEAQVEEFTANPPLKIDPLPSAPDPSTYAIWVNCTIPACVPGGMDPAMDALGWEFEEQSYDISKGPAAVQAAFTEAIAKEPDVIIVGLNFPADAYQAQVDEALAQGIKLIGWGGTETPSGFSACVQCTPATKILGGLAGNIVVADAGGETHVAVLIDKTIPAFIDETNGVKEEVAKNGDGSEVMEIEQSISATPADNAAGVVSFLQRNPDVEYLVLTSPQFDPSAALKSAGLDQVKIVGIYPFSDVEVEAVKDGQVLAYAAGELGAGFWRAADAAARAVQDVEVDPAEPVPAMRVMNQSNADAALLDPTDYQNVYMSAWQLQ